MEHGFEEAGRVTYAKPEHKVQDWKEMYENRSVSAGEWMVELVYAETGYDTATICSAWQDNVDSQEADSEEMIDVAICVLKSERFPELNHMFIPVLAEVKNLHDPEGYIWENLDF
jgi:hypothetical protein